MTIITNSEKETELAGENLSKTLKPGTIVALFGEMGTGKTAFVRGMARGLGVTCRVTSPTFTIVNEYKGTIDLFHFDMYRLKSADELFDIGWEDYLSRNGICAVEWSENVTEALDGCEITVQIEKVSETARSITINGGQTGC